MGIVKEFKTFALRGNVMDMAIGIIIGAAFGKIVSSLVTDIIMPPIGLLIGGVDFSNLSFILKEAALDSSGAVLTSTVTLNYGIFINTVIDFLIIAFAIFMVIKGMNSVKKKEEEKPTTIHVPSKEELLLTEIRDLLKK